MSVVTLRHARPRVPVEVAAVTTETLKRRNRLISQPSDRCNWGPCVCSMCSCRLEGLARLHVHPPPLKCGDLYCATLCCLYTAGGCTVGASGVPSAAAASSSSSRVYHRKSLELNPNGSLARCRSLPPYETETQATYERNGEQRKTT